MTTLNPAAREAAAARAVALGWDELATTDHDDMDRIIAAYLDALTPADGIRLRICVALDGAEIDTNCRRRRGVQVALCGDGDDDGDDDDKARLEAFEVMDTDRGYGALQFHWIEATVPAYVVTPETTVQGSVEP